MITPFSSGAWMRTGTAIEMLFGWYALSGILLVVFSTRAMIEALRTRMTFALAKAIARAYAVWFAWTLGYSLLMLVCLVLAAWTNRPEVLVLSIVVYMGLGYLIGLRLKVQPLARRLMMLGAPPLQAAVTLATRSPFPGAPPR
jgi:hypothetical protein